MVPESTVRNFKRAYLSELKACSDPELVHLREKVRGRPLLLGELDKKVQSYINRFDAVSAYMRKMDHYGLSDF